MHDKSSGWYRMERGWQSHPVFSNEPYTDREAFEWLIANACWKPQVFNIKGNPVELKEGQLTHSVRFLADMWQWKKDKVNRYLSKLVKFNMIETDSATGQNIVTICNYTKYQGERDSAATVNETEARQERDKYKEINNIINTDDVKREASKTVQLGKQIAKITGWDQNPNWFGDYSMIAKWLDGGW